MKTEKEALDQIGRLPPLLRHLAEKMMKLSRERQPVDPTRFEDPVARQTQWTPARKGGSNFRTRSFRERSHHRLEFSISPGGLIFGLMFLLSGLTSLLLTIFHILPKMEGIPLFARIFLPLSSLVFILAGAWLIFSFSRPVVFDKELGWFWKGYRSPSLSGGGYKPKNGTPLNRVYALQILAERVRGSNSSYTSYELNLVCRDAGRINLVDHGHYENIRKEAETLSAFLGIPVWDTVAPDRGRCF